MNIGIYAIFSELHDRQKIERSLKDFSGFASEGIEVKFIDRNQFHSVDLIIIAVLTGGSESAFVRLFPDLKACKIPFALFALPRDNSLPATIEIKTWLNLNSPANQVSILHGEPSQAKPRIHALLNAAKVLKDLRQSRLGVIGRPSEWLIAAPLDAADIQQRIGIEFVEISMNEFKGALEQDNSEFHLPETLLIAAEPSFSPEEIKKAERIYSALRRVIRNYCLNGVTLRCFDLLTNEKTTGCLALAALNDEGIIAGCEGDIPAAASMLVAARLLQKAVFMANPSRVEEDSAIFAHCTCPVSILQDFALATHFESDIGMAVSGKFEPGPVTIFKVAGNGESFIAADGEILELVPENCFCRTQARVKISGLKKYLFENPLGNHQILIPGHHTASLRALCQMVGMKSAWPE